MGLENVMSEVVIDREARRREILSDLAHHRQMIDLIGALNRRSYQPGLSRADIKNVQSHRADIKRLATELEELDKLK